MAEVWRTASGTTWFLGWTGAWGRMPLVSSSSAALVELAHSYGIATDYTDWRGRPVDVPAESVAAVLTAMGVSETDARASLRFSLGRSSTRADVAALVSALPEAVGRARAAAAFV